MGTEITLSIRGVDLDYSKNSRGVDHGALFQEIDRGRIRSDQIDYDYFDDRDDSDLADMELGFSRRLGDIKERVELLGFGIDTARLEYEHQAKQCAQENEYPESEGLERNTELLSFDEFLETISTITISNLCGGFDDNFLERGFNHYGKKFIKPETVRRFPFFDERDDRAYSEQSYLSGLLGFLHPYNVIRLLATNEDNLDELVVWQYGPLVNAGWASADEFVPNARRSQTFLVATEGDSDVEILDKAFRYVAPNIADFFRFIDMSEGHPFGGTGPLQKFANGLVKIDVQNNTIFLFDNDAEGVSALNKVAALKLPANMRVTKLPDRPQFEHFPTTGPSGESVADINGRAAAIECYLDLEQPDLPTPVVRWGNYKGDVRRYQGALVAKDKFTKHFLRLELTSPLAEEYDWGGLRCILDALRHEASALASDLRAALR